MKLFLINTFIFYPEADNTKVKRKNYYQLEFKCRMFKIIYSLIWNVFSSLFHPYYVMTTGKDDKLLCPAQYIYWFYGSQLNLLIKTKKPTFNINELDTITSQRTITIPVTGDLVVESQTRTTVQFFLTMFSAVHSTYIRTNWVSSEFPANLSSELLVTLK